MVTSEEFEKYEAVRKSGLTNMFDVRRVQELCGLPHKTCFEIMRNYSVLKERYQPPVKSGEGSE